MKLKGIQYILLDIEGTVSDKNFVHNVLFPYSAEHLEDYIYDHQESVEVKEALELLAEKDIDKAIHTLLSFIREDVKHPALKLLQGYIWKSGFESKAFTAPLYDDVMPALETWQSSYTIGIYSSGSVKAQKLFFSHTSHGDITNFFANYFDLAMGSKKEPESYQKIARTLGMEASTILFLSDIPDEIKAARKADLQAIHVVRPGTENWEDDSIKSFSDLLIQ